MTLLLDSGIIYAYYDRSDAWHRKTLALFHKETGFIVPAPVIPEVDHLLGTRLGSRARQLFYRGLIDGGYFVADLPRDRYARVLEIDTNFAELDLGFVDCAIVAISESTGVSRIATTDRRDFEPLAAAFSLTLLP